MKPSFTYLLLLCLLGSLPFLHSQEPSSPLPAKPFQSDSLTVQDSLKKHVKEQIKELMILQEQYAQFPTLENPSGASMPVFRPRTDNLAPMPVAPIDTTIHYTMPIIGLQPRESVNLKVREKK